MTSNIERAARDYVRHDGPAGLTKLETVHGPLAETVEGLTGGGGTNVSARFLGK